MNERVARPARPHDAVTRAGPALATSGTVHVHVARPPAEYAPGSPDWDVPSAYRTASTQVTPAGRVVTVTVTDFPWRTRPGKLLNEVLAAAGPRPPVLATAAVETTQDATAQIEAIASPYAALLGTNSILVRTAARRTTYTGSFDHRFG